MSNRFLRATLKSTEETLSSFQFVKPDIQRLLEIARTNAPLIGDKLPPWDYPGCQPISNHVFPSQCFFWNVINFCFDNSRRNGDGKLIKFGTKTVLNEDVRGSYAMAACFYRFSGENPIDSWNILPLLKSFSAFKNFFRGATRMPMMRERYELLLEARFILEEKFGGDVRCLLEEGGYRAFGENGKKGIVELLVERFPRAFGEDWFADTSGYFNPPGRKFYFNKRAQLFVLMYHDRAANSGGELRPIEDIEEIGPIADYELPKRYVEDGILFYNPALRSAIERAMPIPRRSQPEVEIRAAFTLVHVLELRAINEERAKRGLPPIHIGHLDYWRWARRGKSGLNHHLCFTTDY